MLRGQPPPRPPSCVPLRSLGIRWPSPHMRIATSAIPAAANAINAVDFLRVLIHLRPSMESKILALARETRLELTPFCAAVRREIGGTLLFDAMMLLQGSAMTTEMSAAAALVRHGVECRAPQCGLKGCRELRGIFSNMKAHAQGCAERTCRTCGHWRMVRDKMKSARRPRLASREWPTPPTAEAKLDDSPAGAALLMLARSALSDIAPTSPRLSPTNTPVHSPNSSPLPKRPKRQQAMPLQQQMQHMHIDATV